MKYCLTIFLLINFVNGNAQQQNFYHEVEAASLKQFQTVDTILKKGSFTVTKRTDSLTRLKTYTEVVEIDFAVRKRYFVLEYNAHFINDTTICLFGPAFKSTSTEGSFMKNGIWVYTNFLTKKSDGPKGERNEVISMQYAVDSLPPNWDYKRLPTDEGIYYYQNRALKKVAAEQSEEKFRSQKKNGFYFIPKSGRLYSKYDIRSIK